MSVLLSHLACCLMVAYTPAMTPSANGAPPLLVPRVAPLQFTPTFDGEQALPNPEITGDLALPPGPFYAPRLICTAIARIGNTIELLGKSIERCSILVSNGAGNITGTLAWLLALVACSRVQEVGQRWRRRRRRRSFWPRPPAPLARAFELTTSHSAKFPHPGVRAAFPGRIVDGLHRPHRPDTGRAQLRLGLRRETAAPRRLRLPHPEERRAPSEDAGGHR